MAEAAAHFCLLQSGSLLLPLSFPAAPLQALVKHGWVALCRWNSCSQLLPVPTAHITVLPSKNPSLPFVQDGGPHTSQHHDEVCKHP